jgi:protein-tyrosine phosphatase
MTGHRHDGLGWLSRRQRDGGIDRVPLPDGVPGALWLCGKHAIGPDHAHALAETGTDTTVVCLVERHELAGRYDAYLAWLEAERGARAVWHPIPDLHAPPPAVAAELVADLVARLRTGASLLVHCAAGMGRTGTIATCVLVALGLTVNEATRTVGAARPGAGAETGAQASLVAAIATASAAPSTPAGE